MRFSEFNRLLKQKNRREEQIKLLFPLVKLYVFHPSNNKLIKLLEDPRSVEFDGKWHIQPIALSDKHVYIVCPYCHEIHSHGNAGGLYEGVRVPHCANRLGLSNYHIIKLRNHHR